MVEVERATQDELQEDLRALLQGAIRITLEMVLKEEGIAMVGARRFERIGSRRDHRNGTFLRRFLTSRGQIDVGCPGAGSRSLRWTCWGATADGPMRSTR